MKTKQTIPVQISCCQGGFGAASDQIPGCVAAAETIDGVIKEFCEGVEFHLEGLAPNEIPECLKGEYEFSYEYTTQALLHHYDGILTRAALSRITGINHSRSLHDWIQNPTPGTSPADN